MTKFNIWRHRSRSRRHRLFLNLVARKTLKFMLALVVLVLVVVTEGCARKNVVAFDVDLYLHPEAGNSQDLLLQTAIQDQLDRSDVTRNSLIHVRVVDKLVLLDGFVESVKEKNEAEKLARDTTVSVNGAAIKVTEVKSHVEVQQ
jgi:hypothetical protein